VSAQAGMITEHRTDAVEQEPAADHARCRRCGRTEKR
jgi:ribosomal protein L37E